MGASCVDPAAFYAGSNNTVLWCCVLSAQLAECAAGRAAELSPEQIRNITVSFAKLGYFNTQFKSAMADAVIAKLNDFEPALLADTAWAFGEALYYDFDLMTHLLPYLKSNAQRFDASGMAKVRLRGVWGHTARFLGMSVHCLWWSGRALLMVCIAADSMLMVCIAAEHNYTSLGGLLHLGRVCGRLCNPALSACFPDCRCCGHLPALATKMRI